MRAYLAMSAVVTILGAAACEGDNTAGRGPKGDRGDPGDPGDPGPAGTAGPPLEVPTCGPIAASDTADATAPIQDCIDRMGAAGGGTVILGAGRYVLKTDHLRFIAGQHDKVRLRGAGEITILSVDRELTKAAILIGSDAESLGSCGGSDGGDIVGGPPIERVTGVSIDGVQIVGNLGGAPDDCCPIDSDAWIACRQYTDSNLTRDGISVRCATDVRITNVMIENTSSSGIAADHAVGLLVDGASIDGPLVDCVASIATERSVVRNVTCNQPGLAGFTGNPATSQLTLQRNAVIDAGQLFQCPLNDGDVWEKPGMLLQGVVDSTIVDNFISGSTGQGIEMQSCSRNIISQNHITDSSRAGIALDLSDACSESGGSDDNLLSGNIIAGGNGGAIRASCASSGNAASANICPDDAIVLDTQGEGSCCNPSGVLSVVAGPCNVPPPALR